jgi:hypothetical protein
MQIIMEDKRLGEATFTTGKDSSFNPTFLNRERKCFVKINDNL